MPKLLAGNVHIFTWREDLITVNHCKTIYLFIYLSFSWNVNCKAVCIGLCCPLPVLYLRCSCPPGWTGPDCGENVKGCLSSPCFNGALCVQSDDPSAFFCTCPPFFTGSLCALPYDPCDVKNNPCLNNSTCRSSPDGSAKCVCPAGEIQQYKTGILYSILLINSSGHWPMQCGPSWWNSLLNLFLVGLLIVYKKVLQRTGSKVFFHRSQLCLYISLHAVRLL